MYLLNISTMFAKLNWGNKILKFLISLMICLCVAIGYYSDSITDWNFVLPLAGRQVDFKLGVGSKVEQKEHQIQNVTQETELRDSEHEYKEYIAKGVSTQHNLCIVDDSSGEKIEIAANVTVTRKILVVYSSAQYSLETVNVAHTDNRADGGRYQIHFQRENRSEHYRYIEDYPAYFITPSCTANLYHFWADSTAGLYKTLKFTNRLGSKIPNQVRHIVII